MSTFDNKGIHFNNVKEYGVKLAAGPVLINGLVGTDPDDGTGIINAIDIDWNGAEMPTSTVSVPATINTTGDLVNAIKWAAQEGTGDYVHPEQNSLDNVINFTTTKLLKVKLNADGHVIAASEFTANDLKNYLEAGDHINITVNNNKVVISYN